MKPAREVIEVNLEELEALLERKRGALGEEDYQKLKKGLWALSYLSELIDDKNTTISQLRALLTKPSTEKTSKVLEQAGVKTPPKNNSPPHANAQVKPKPGHGRNGARAYEGARRIKIAHAALKPGDHCPECWKGKVYAQREPGLRVRVVGQAPIAATVYELERLRCNLCGEVFEADAPAGVGEEKYDATAAAMIALMKYGTGVPWDRLDKLEASLGIPLPASTQWEIVEATAALVRPAFEELIRQAAQGEVFYNDDTSMKILALARASPRRAEEEEASDSKERTGLFTSGIVSTREGRRIALFFTGRNHAGENFARVLAERGQGLPPPIQMSDALSRNVPKLQEKLEILWGNCNAHARRRFVQVTSNFPQECQFVLESRRKHPSKMAEKRASDRTRSEKVFGHPSKQTQAELRVGLYARVSTHDQQTIPLQIRAMREYATRRGWEIALQVKEVGSGAVQREKRERLLETARRREIDVVLVWRLDRWGRSVTDLLATLQELGHLGVGFVSLTEALDLTTPAGRAMAGLLAVFAEFEREILRERVRAGLAQARQNGQRLGRPLTAALHTDRVRKLYRAGIAKAEIARRLRIGRTSVRRILKERV